MLDITYEPKLLTDKQIAAALCSPNCKAKYGNIVSPEGGADIIGFAKNERGARWLACQYFRAYLEIGEREKVSMSTIIVTRTEIGDFQVNV
jgi:hypothetical protein